MDTKLVEKVVDIREDKVIHLESRRFDDAGFDNLID